MSVILYTMMFTYWDRLSIYVLYITHARRLKDLQPVISELYTYTKIYFWLYYVFKCVYFQDEDDSNNTWNNRNATFTVVFVLEEGPKENQPWHMGCVHKQTLQSVLKDDITVEHSDINSVSDCFKTCLTSG